MIRSYSFLRLGQQMKGFSLGFSYQKNVVTLVTIVNGSIFLVNRILISPHQNAKKKQPEQNAMGKLFWRYIVNVMKSVMKFDHLF